MKLARKAGSTSQSIQVFIADSSSSVGAGLSGLVYNTSGLTAYYVRTRSAPVQITLATLAATTSAYSSGGFKEIDATNMKGVYRLDIPDAALASGADSVVIYLQGAANMAPLPIEIDLGAQVDVSSVNGVSTSPVTTIKAVQGLAVDGVVTTVTNQLTAAQIATGVWQDTTAGDFTLNNSIGKSIMNGVSLGTGLTILNLTNAPSDSSGVTTLLTRLTSTRAGYLDNLSGGAVALASTALSSAVWTGGRAAALDYLDASILSRMATFTLPTNFSALAITAGGSVTAGTVSDKTGYALTSGERTAIANEVEAQIIDETDNEKVLTAITDKIASVNPSLGGLSVAAIASAAATSVWSSVSRTLTAGDNIVLAKGTGVTGFNDLSQANVRTAIGLAAADLDTQLDTILDAIPVEVDIAAAVVDHDIGNGRTVGYFLQGGMNKIVQAANGLSFTVYGTDDTTELYTGTTTRLATTVGAVRNLIPG